MEFERGQRERESKLAQKEQELLKREAEVRRQEMLCYYYSNHWLPYEYYYYYNYHYHYHYHDQYY